MNRIKKTFENLKKNNRKALGIFLTAGDPDMDTSLEILTKLPPNGVDFIETFNWSIPERWLKHSLLTFNNKDLSVIAWIQDYKSKEILQVTEFNFD